MTIDWQLNLGHVITAITALLGVVATASRLSAKIDGMRDGMHEVSESLKEHAQEDTRRFDEITRVLYRLAGRVGNGG